MRGAELGRLGADWVEGAVKDAIQASRWTRAGVGVSIQNRDPDTGWTAGVRDCDE